MHFARDKPLGVWFERYIIKRGITANCDTLLGDFHCSLASVKAGDLKGWWTWFHEHPPHWLVYVESSLGMSPGCF
jgi:hypothetical protein